MSTPTTHSWDAYAAEAQHPPFVLQVSGQEDIVIEAPSGAAGLKAASALRADDAEAMLWALCGEAWPRVKDLIATAPLDAMMNLLWDLNLHFDMLPSYQMVGPSGGTRRVKDPREIERLTDMGWQIAVGKAPTSNG